MWKSILIPGSKGSEGGEALADEEYERECRITLEKCKTYYAITCGIYGGMMHTAFCGEEDCWKKYEAMKRELQDFLERETDKEEKIRFYEMFTSKY